MISEFNVYSNTALQQSMKKSVFKIQQSQHSVGMSLSELMIALTLGAILLTGLIQISDTVNKGYSNNHSLNNVRDQGQFTLDLLESAIRMRGYYGCLVPAKDNEEVKDIASYQTENWRDKTTVKPVASNFHQSVLSLTSLRGYVVNTGNTWLPDPLGQKDTLNNFLSKEDVEKIKQNGTGSTVGDPKARPGSDVIAMQYASFEGAEVTSDMVDPFSPLTISNAEQDLFNFQQGNLVFAGHCLGGDLFTISNNPTNSGGVVTIEHLSDSGSRNRFDYLQNPYMASEQTKIRRFFNYIFFVAETPLKSVSGEKIYGLYRDDMSNSESPELMSEGVEFVKFLYGVRLESDNITFVEADNALLNNTGMLPVVAVKMSLLMTSVESVLPHADTKTYQLNNTTVGPSEYSHSRGLKKVFTKTVHLKNRA